MTRPPLEVADIVRSAGPSFVERNRQWINGQHKRCCRRLCGAVPPHWEDVAPKATNCSAQLDGHGRLRYSPKTCRKRWWLRVDHRQSPK